MKGTTFSVKEAIRLIPPTKINAEITATKIPTTHFGIPKAVKKASLMEFDWTIFPMIPRDRIVMTAKNTASILPKLPLKAS